MTGGVVVHVLEQQLDLRRREVDLPADGGGRLVKGLEDRLLGVELHDVADVAE